MKLIKWRKFYESLYIFASRVFNKMHHTVSLKKGIRCEIFIGKLSFTPWQEFSLFWNINISYCIIRKKSLSKICISGMVCNSYLIKWKSLHDYNTLHLNICHLMGMLGSWKRDDPEDYPRNEKKITQGLTLI